MRTLNADGVGVGGAVDCGQRTANCLLGSAWAVDAAKRNLSGKIMPECELWAGVSGALLQVER